MQVNKELIKAKIEDIKTESGQDSEGQFMVGTPEQQHAAKMVEDFYNNFEESKKLDEDTLSLATAATIVALKDIQVRDYALGLMNPADNKTREFFTWLTDASPSDYISAPTTLLALTYYEKEDSKTAVELLTPALAHDYSLARLLNRVFISGWPIAAFNAMRIELHPKVVALIFANGETDDSSK